MLGGLAVVLGAVGAHALKGHLIQEQQALFQTAWTYQMSHALALGLVGGLQTDNTTRMTHRLMVLCWFLGTLIFSGTLYALALGAPRVLAHVTPLGGLLLMTGWGCLIIESLRTSFRPTR